MVQQNRPVYEYYFTKTNSRLSNNHAGELPYAYGNLHYNDANYNESDYKLSEIMQNYWVNFAKTGNPNGENLPDWPAVTADQPLLINFDNEITLMEDPNLPLYKVIDRFMEDED
jgi:para-nitrobenzyl esterase